MRSAIIVKQNTTVISVRGKIEQTFSMKKYICILADQSPIKQQFKKHTQSSFVRLPTGSTNFFAPSGRPLDGGHPEKVHFI